MTLPGAPFTGSEDQPVVVKIFRRSRSLFGTFEEENTTPRTGATDRTNERGESGTICAKTPVAKYESYLPGGWGVTRKESADLSSDGSIRFPAELVVAPFTSLTVPLHPPPKPLLSFHLNVQRNRSTPSETTKKCSNVFSSWTNKTRLWVSFVIGLGDGSDGLVVRAWKCHTNCPCSTRPLHHPLYLPSF